MFFGEALEWATLAGTAIIVASGLYIVFREQRGGHSTTTPVLRTRSRMAAPSAPRISPFLAHTRNAPQGGHAQDPAGD